MQFFNFIFQGQDSFRIFRKVIVGKHCCSVMCTCVMGKGIGRRERRKGIYVDCCCYSNQSTSCSSFLLLMAGRNIYHYTKVIPHNASPKLPHYNVPTYVCTRKYPTSTHNGRRSASALKFIHAAQPQAVVEDTKSTMPWN